MQASADSSSKTESANPCYGEGFFSKLLKGECRAPWRVVMPSAIADKGTMGHQSRCQSTVSAQSRMADHGLFSKEIETIDDLLLHGLKDIYYAENQIVKSLPKLIDK